MPYERSIRFRTSLILWQDVRLQEGQDTWSPAYCAESPRLYVPRAHWLECELAGTRRICDPVSPLWLTPEDNYRMRQPRGQHAGVVLALDASFHDKARTRPMLSAKAQLELAKLDVALRTDKSDPLAIEEVLLDVIHQALATALQNGCSSHRSVERAREFLASRPELNDSLKQIAKAAHCSPFHLARQFRHHTGCSLHQYRTRLRMSLALQRVRGGENDFSALAADLGYSSHSHFSAVFRRTFGSTPCQLRTNLTARRAH